MADLAHIFPSPPPAPSIEPDLTVTFLLLPRFTLLPFAGFIDCLRLAADESDHSRQVHCRWQVTAPSLEPVHASCGIPINPELTFVETCETDYLVVVGGLLPWSMDVPDEILQHLREAHTKGTSIMGLCTGSFVLARAGLLAGRRCAVNFMHAKQMKTLFPDTIPITDQNYVVDDGIITCNGGTSSIDLVCALIESRSGKARAIKALNSLMVDTRRTAHHMAHHPYEYLTTCGNRRVEQGVAFMQQNLSNPYSISALAARLNSSERELTRAFRKHANASPAELYRNMRLAHGHWLLSNTNRSITQVAFECGFADAAHFNRWFRQVYNESPGLFRDRRRRISDA